MKKKKFDLTADLVNTNSTDDKNNITVSQLPKNNTVLLTMSIEEELRAEFKAWCARHRLKMNEAFIKSFKLLKDKYGP